ncbi:copper homeostasis protein [Nonlabens dokdonensis]|jgi:copper homeostasis protein|uniref:PF03932 family protein CutC n=2 Tax=Nonlabens dokdonensis TaxID=328515 RepID=L7WEN5_NONDD|nr:copper homeostasis protein CutC [Nonlabens dokdonensis]AGC78737.1 copper homeostasis protein CutC [Nonlabens dokdonensis DSW-6]PZX39137.1 copper homeostasis protein [Nonlabens dokdonensis]
MLLEICASNYQSALNAQKAGAHRIELCSELAVGGITPSYGLLKKVMEELTIPVMVLIRPRSGNFVFSNADFDIMKRDIELCKELGCAGIVSGVLTADFKIDIRRTSELIELARPLPFTFHRAFDHINNPEQAVVDLVNLGAKRILTSGQYSKAIDGLENLKRYQEIGSDELIIMPGGGINAGNNSAFAKANFKEVHASATEIIEQTKEEKVPMNSPKFLQENIEVISGKENITTILKNLQHED